ncbi:hypothetical protein [Zymobacter palmae]|nr:hypothetical protein [Zymobacter palmae]
MMKGSIERMAALKELFQRTLSKEEHLSEEEGDRVRASGMAQACAFMASVTHEPVLYAQCQQLLADHVGCAEDVAMLRALIDENDTVNEIVRQSSIARWL